MRELRWGSCLLFLEESKIRGGDCENCEATTWTIYSFEMAKKL
jgi:hypothetical protein